MKYIKIPVEAASVLIQYLQCRPWKEVNDFVQLIGTAKVEEDLPVPPPTDAAPCSG